MTVAPMCCVGRVGPYDPDERKCGRYAVDGSSYCRKHDPKRIAAAIRAQAAGQSTLASVSTETIMAELARRGVR